MIEGDGEVTGITVEAVSGCPPLDDSAADALDEVILPRCPPTFPREREVVHARFIARSARSRRCGPRLARLQGSRRVLTGSSRARRLGPGGRDGLL